MGGVVEIAGAILSRAFAHTEISAQNLANMTTPGYKARLFSDFASRVSDSTVDRGTATYANRTAASADFSAGKLQNTGSPFDLALSGQGFFVVREGDQLFYTRDGQFSRGSDGKIVTADGLALQSADGNDVVVSGNNPKILADGTVLENGQPTSQIAVENFSDPSMLKSSGSTLFTAPAGEASDGDAEIQQGMIESSNVSTAQEMISIMAALRSAESGQKLVQVYDDLMGQAVNAFGQM
jgi:flagellar basal-body rod protein FlgF